MTSDLFLCLSQDNTFLFLIGETIWTGRTFKFAATFSALDKIKVHFQIRCYFVMLLITFLEIRLDDQLICTLLLTLASKMSYVLEIL